jgi:DNA-directed RNA polymerase specialized sigma24 family protein
MSASKPAKTVAEVLKELPEEERIILTMHLLRGLSAPEIANLIGVPERAVLSLISSGKSRLSALLVLFNLS